MRNDHSPTNSRPGRCFLKRDFSLWVRQLLSLLHHSFQCHADLHHVLQLVFPQQQQQQQQQNEVLIKGQSRPAVSKARLRLRLAIDSALQVSPPQGVFGELKALPKFMHELINHPTSRFFVLCHF